MPLPKPQDNESRNDFVNRCLEDDDAKKEFPTEKQRLAVCLNLFKREELAESNSDKVSAKVEEGLKNKLKDHKEKVGSDPKKQTTLRKLKIVYNRGIGAYRTNPSSVRPTVTSPEQWAMARVNSFLRALRNGRFSGGKHDTDLLPKDHPAKTTKADSHRNYPDGEVIPSALPDAYRKSKDEGETKGQACINCKFYEEEHEDHRFYCKKFKAPVRPQYWCKAWESNGEAFAESYNDYPESATNNAKKVLRWKEEHGDEVKGMTAVGWNRANQLARREKLSRSTIARMASFKRHQKNAEIDPKYKSTPWKDRGYVAWLGWGGTSGVEWAIRKLKQIDKKSKGKMSSNYQFSTNTIKLQKIDPENGEMLGVSIIQIGEAIGHELYIDSKSLDSILSSIEGTKLPAYITHSGAMVEDRLTREVGYFENFERKDDKILADFIAFNSFKQDDSKTYNRLFELAEKTPNNFGLSIVFSGSQVWATEDGDVEGFEEPENALYEHPSIRVHEVSSADFVDSPASNTTGLFNNKPNHNSMGKQTQLNEEAIEDSVTLSEDKLAQHEEEMDSHEEEEKMESHEEEKMDSHEEEMDSLEEEEKMEEHEEEDKDAKLAELEKKLAEKDEEISKLKEELNGKEEKVAEKEESLSKLDAEVVELRALIKGSEPLESNSESNDIYEPTKEALNKLIKDTAKERGVSEFTATLQLGREKPNLFKTL